MDSGNIHRIPKTYDEFSRDFPGLAGAWDAIRKAEKESGPLDEKTRRLVKLGIAVGAQQKGTVHSAVRKLLKAGASKEEIFQVMTLSASTIGLPSTVAAYTWAKDILEQRGEK